MKKRIRSAIPIYLCALAWAICACFLPMYKISSILICAGVSIAVWLVAGRIFPGRTIDVEQKPDSGDAEVDRQIEEGRRALGELKAAQAEFEQAGKNGLAAPMKRMLDAGDRIFAALEKQPRDSQQVRKFMNYYLPTSVKLISHYKTLSAAGEGENVLKSLSGIEESLDMIAGAFEKQLDRLYADDQLDISAEISALETMMAADGLTEENMMKVQSRS